MNVSQIYHRPGCNKCYKIDLQYVPSGYFFKPVPFGLLNWLDKRSYETRRILSVGRRAVLAFLDQRTGCTGSFMSNCILCFAAGYNIATTTHFKDGQCL